MDRTFIQNGGESAQDEKLYTPGQYTGAGCTFDAMVLAALLDGKKLTVRNTGYKTRVGYAVSLLQAHGWRINVRNSRIDVYAGEPARFKTYSLNPDQIARAHGSGLDWSRMVKLAHDIKDGSTSTVEMNALLIETKVLLVLSQVLRRRKG